jgi:hypothetical protein
VIVLGAKCDFLYFAAIVIYYSVKIGAGYDGFFIIYPARGFDIATIQLAGNFCGEDLCKVER